MKYHDIIYSRGNKYIPLIINGMTDMDPHLLETILLLALTVALIILNGFFVATEFAIVKVRVTRIRELADDGNLTAIQVNDVLNNIDSYLSAAQLGITLASLGLGWIGEPAIADRIVIPIFTYFKMNPDSTFVTTISFIIAFLIITTLHIVFGEQAPKMMAIQSAEKITMAVAKPMKVIMWLFKPFIFLLNHASNGTLKIMGIKIAEKHEVVHSEEELRMIINASGLENGGELGETQAELLDNVFDFGHRLARQVMAHRTDMIILDVDESLSENIQLAMEGGHTRYPVMREDADNIIGFCHTKDLFALYQGNKKANLQEITRPVLMVPENVQVMKLLRQMQRERQHIAVIVDEYGGTAGLVTISDLLEEIVGDLPDEFEPVEQEWIIKISDDVYNVDGRLPMADLEEEMGKKVSCEESCDTVGGFAYWAFGKIPETGEEITKGSYTIKVLEMDGNRVSRVEIRYTLIIDDNDSDNAATE
jgi:CBS domain containing-hemolysin-like protein